MDPSRSAPSTWFFCASEDQTASALMSRMLRLGMPFAASPESAARAVVVLSPELAEENPIALRNWAHERGVEMLALTLSSGAAPWDDHAGRFSTDADAVPPGLHDAFTVQPIMLDLSGAGPAKLDRCARRLAGAMGPPSPPSATPPPALPAEPAAAPPRLQPRKGRRLELWVASAVAALLIGLLLMSIMRAGGSGSSSVRPTTATTVAMAPPASAAPGPTPSASESNGFLWVVAALFAVGSAGVVVALRGRRRRSRAAESRPLPQSETQTGELQVFISHDVGTDSEVASRLADRLVQGRLRVWFAPGSLHPGDDFVTAIADAISSSRAALILLSPTALRSNWVRREMAWIVNREIEGHLHVVPVRVADCDVPLLLSTYQWVDVADFDRAVGELVRLAASAAPS